MGAKIQKNKINKSILYLYYLYWTLVITCVLLLTEGDEC